MLVMYGVIARVEWVAASVTCQNCQVDLLSQRKESTFYAVSLQL